MRIARVLLFCLREYCFGSSAEAQSGGMIVAHSLPDDLQSSLEERFSAFVEAQAAGHWGELADLLGRGAALDAIVSTSTRTTSAWCRGFKLLNSGSRDFRKNLGGNGAYCVDPAEGVYSETPTRYVVQAVSRQLTPFAVWGNGSPGYSEKGAIQAVLP
jgi:hypothetical protein